MNLAHESLFFRDPGHPPRWGLWYGTVLFHRHTDEVARFNGDWWAQIERYSRRDQISLPVIPRIAVRCLGVAGGTRRNH